jgi:hypothetical protein
VAQRQSRNAINPLPSLIQASAFDAANMRMVHDGRKQWNDDDWNAMCETQERLVTQLYGRETDSDPNIKYVRFSTAAQLEKQGDFTLHSTPAEIKHISAWIDEYLAGQMPVAA